MADHFDAEPLIIERIRSLGIAELRTVASVSLLAGSHNIMSHLPGVFVMPGGGQMSPDTDGRLQVETQFWQVVVVVQHITDTRRSETTASQAGRLASAVLRSLIGWRPSVHHKPLALIDRPDPAYEPGYAEFPFVFRTQITVEGA